MKDSRSEHSPPPVSERDRPGGEAYGRWPWVERCVWTERMLETLERGPRNGVWHSLIDKVYAERTLWAAWEKVQGQRGSERSGPRHNWRVCPDGRAED